MFYIGLDLGQRHDHSAIVIIERQDVHLAFLAPRHDKLLVRWVERLPLGTPYPGVVDRIRQIVRQLNAQCVLIVDSTGVGAPVVELLRSAQLGCEITAVTITGGAAASGHGASRNVPKRDLIAGLQLHLEKESLRIAPNMKEVSALLRELLDVRIAAGLATGNVKIGAEGHGEHDDLVIALALACWRAGQKEIGYGTRSLGL